MNALPLGQPGSPQVPELSDAQLFAQIASQVETLNYLLQFGIQRAGAEAPVQAYMLRVARRHVGDVLSFSRSGLGVEISEEQVARLQTDPDYILAQRAPAMAG